MLPISTNILDQLLGGFETQPTGPTGTSGVSSGEGLTFGDMLGQMLGSTTATDRVLPQNIQNLFPPNDRSVAQDGAPAGPTVEASLLSVMSTGLNNGWLLDSNPAETQGSAIDHNPLEAELLDRRLPFDNMPISSLDPTKLTSINSKGLPNTAGYTILDAQIEGEQIELSLLPKDNAGDPLRISLPLTVFEEAILAKIGNGGTFTGLKSLAHQGTNTTTPGLDRLLKELNLKSLEIREAAAPMNNGAQSTPVELTLIGEDQGARLVLTARMSRNDLFVRTSDDHGSSQSFQASETTLIDDSHSTEGSASDDKPTDFEMLLKRPLSENGRALTKNSLLDTKTFSLDAFTSVEGSGKLAPKDITTQSVNTPTPVRLTLPETISRPFFSNGQTIMIKIEPEHLGPARLNLAVHDQMLTARVTVETATARMAVESSLHQLNDQLAKAGIQVDRIDVVLSDSGTRHQFHDHRPFWTQSRKVRQLKDENEFMSDSITRPTPLSLHRQYVGTQGVNLLA